MGCPGSMLMHIPWLCEVCGKITNPGYRTECTLGCPPLIETTSAPNNEAESAVFINPWNGKCVHGNEKAECKEEHVSPRNGEGHG